MSTYLASQPMSYDYQDAAWDDAYERVARELYPEQKALAILDFTYDRLRSYYVQHKDLLVPAVRTYNLAESLLKVNHPAPSFVFAVSAIELFLKACLLRPVVAGLVHSEAVADLLVESSLSQTGFKRYGTLLAGLFKELMRIEISSIVRQDASRPILEEVAQLQDRRNAVIHRGEDVSLEEASRALAIAKAVFDQILAPVLNELGMSLERGVSLLTARPRTHRAASPGL